MKKITCTILLLAGVFGCRPFELPESRSVLNVTDVTVDSINSTTIVLTASGVATQCERVDDVDIIAMDDTQNGQEISYRISLSVINTTCGSFNGDKDTGDGGSGPGSEVLLVPISTSVSFQYQGNGAYVFRFIRTDNTFFEETVNVN